MTVLLMLRSAAKESLRPQRQGHFGAQSHTPRNSCVRFAAGVAAGLAQHSLPGGALRPTWAGLSPVDRASFLAHPLPTLQCLRITIARPSVQRIDRLHLLDDLRRDGADLGDELLQLLAGHRR